MEIFNLPIKHHELFAKTTSDVEAFHKSLGIEFNLDALYSPLINNPLLIADPTYSALDSLFGLKQKAVWAKISAPPGFRTQQKTHSPYLSPNFGNTDMIEESIVKMKRFLESRCSKNRKAKAEGSLFIRLLEDGFRESCDMIDFILSRVYQFLKG